MDNNQRIYGLPDVPVSPLLMFMWNAALDIGWILYDVENALYSKFLIFLLPQGDAPGTTRLLRVRVIAGVHLAKKDIFGAR